MCMDHCNVETKVVAIPDPPKINKRKKTTYTNETHLVGYHCKNLECSAEYTKAEKKKKLLKIAMGIFGFLLILLIGALGKWKFDFDII